MNFRTISYILGWVLLIEGGFLLLPYTVGLIYGESEAVSFLITAAICAAVGAIAVIKKPKQVVFFVREGFVTVALSWLIMSLFGAIPFVINGDIPSYVNAFFETVSGFTTTGSSILADVESLSYASNFWRCFTHWIGGMGVLVFLLAILPLVGGSQMHLMRAESPGPSVSKLVPKTRSTALILYSIYIALSVLQFVILLICDMPVYDAITTTFGTAGTGGFSIKNSSIAGYSPAVQWVVAVFMVLFGVNFNIYFLLLLKKFKTAICSEELRTYIGIITASTLFVFFNILSEYSSADGLRHAFFQVSSIITTTGYATADFDLWPSFSKIVLVLIMFIGACAGSTGGGIKVSRCIILAKRARQELYRYIYPNRVTKIHLEGKILSDEVIHTTSAYIVTYLLVFICSVLLISIENHDTTTVFTAVAATINNIGPGLSMVGPSQNFGFFGNFSKIVLSFDMLIGRLELFPMLLLFNPRIWSKKI